jgi:ThiF family
VHEDGLNPANALALVSAYDVVVDASDNAHTRYLVSDACVIAGRPLVSGAALGMDGQMTVYHYGADGEPGPRTDSVLRVLHCLMVLHKGFALDAVGLSALVGPRGPRSGERVLRVIACCVSSA